MLTNDQRRQVLARARTAVRRAHETREQAVVVQRRVHRDRDALRRSIAAKAGPDRS